MTPCEEELLTKYLTHLNVLGGDAYFADFEERYQPVRYANAARRPADPLSSGRDSLQGHPRRTAADPI